ncbi:Hachiman antiphage defense system protein HamA [Kocuria carniphila]|uniref:Hachiman antiphage defense system protein HamA n=1 Tax=Kocuria carniphila TaxID=262208 RepID=A0ABV3V5S7_9MICC
MTGISTWSTTAKENIDGHELHHLVVGTSDTDQAIAWAAATIPSQYASPARVARLLSRLGKSAAAAYIENKLPTTPRARSGELGEIVGTRYASDELGYQTIARLRWADHREMAMRGDDIIGVRATGEGSVEFLKGEAKSRAQLGNSTVSEADDALQRDNGRPSPHALEFVADRLHNGGQSDLADLIDDAMLVKGIRQRQVQHLLFTFSGNDPRTPLRTNTQRYHGRIRRFAVGVQVPEHQAFVAAVYTKVIDNARER